MLTSWLKLTCRESEMLDWFDSERREGDLFTWNDEGISGVARGLCVIVMQQSSQQCQQASVSSYLGVFIQKQSAHRHLFFCLSSESPPLLTVMAIWMS